MDVVLSADAFLAGIIPYVLDALSVTANGQMRYVWCVSELAALEHVMPRIASKACGGVRHATAVEK